MAIQRVTAAQIETAVLQIMGYTSSAYAPWLTAANFYLRVNEYLQRLPQKATMLAKQMGIIATDAPALRFDMWKSSCNSAGNTVVDVQVGTGSSTGYMPTDYDQIISMYDVTAGRELDVLENVDKYFIDELRNKVPGPPEAIEIMGYMNEAGRWRRWFTIYPATATGVTPVFTMKYYRIPASITAAGSYPDIDPKYESIAIYGTVCDLGRSIGLEFPRYDALEKEMLNEMIMTARSI